MTDLDHIVAQRAREIYNTRLRRVGWDASWENASWVMASEAVRLAREELAREKEDMP